MSDQPRKMKVPALTERYPPGCPDPDWCSGNGYCAWSCIDDESDELDPDVPSTEGHLP